MANLLDRFKNTSVGSANKDLDYTDFIAPFGDFQQTTGLTTIINSWKNILLTSPRTYDHDPEYGSNLKEYVFAQADQQTREDISVEIEESLMRYDSRAEIQDIRVIFLSNLKGFIIEIDVLYEGQSTTIDQRIDETLVG